MMSLSEAMAQLEAVADVFARALRRRADEAAGPINLASPDTLAQAVLLGRPLLLTEQHANAVDDHARLALRNHDPEQAWTSGHVARWIARQHREARLEGFALDIIGHAEMAMFHWLEARTPSAARLHCARGSSALAIGRARATRSAS
jgi:hypothetical protein